MHTMLLMDIIIVLLGIYLISIALRMKQTKKIDNFIVDAQVMAHCRNEKAFAEFLYPKMLIFAVVLVITGGIRMLADTIVNIGYWAYVVAIIALFAFLWFFKELSDAKSKFC